MKKLELDKSLTLKIIQNELRLKELFTTTSKRNRNYSLNYKFYNTEKASNNENFSSSKICNVHRGFGNDYINDESDIFQISSQKTMELERENTKSIIKVNTNKNSRANSKSKKNKMNKTSKLDTSLNPFVNKIKDNPINSFHNYSSGKNSLNRNVTSIRYINVEKMINRFRENEEKIKEWIKREQTKKEIEENKHYQASPKINKKSKKINLKIKDCFLLRLQKSEDEKQKKAEMLKEFLKNKKMEEEKKREMKGKSRTKKGNLSIDKKIGETLNKFQLWDEKRKAKINLKRKIKFEKENMFDFIPKINKRSTSMAELKKKNYSNKNLYERLAKMNKYSGEKKKV